MDGILADVRFPVAYRDGEQVEPIITQLVFDALPELKKREAPSSYVSRQQLEELFGISKHPVKVAHAPLLRGETPHRMDVEALQSFIAAYGAGDAERHLKLEPTSSWPDTLSGTLVLAGGPVSNALTRILMQYTCLVPADPRKGLIREIGRAYLDFRYTYLLNPVLLQQFDLLTPEGESWAVYDRRQQQFLTASHEPNAVQDYQLITVVPNLFDLESFERGDKVIIFGGAHGIAQVGITELLRSEALITTLREATREHPFWQALFEIRLRDGQQLPPTYLGAAPVRLNADREQFFCLFNEWIAARLPLLGIDREVSENILLEDAGVEHPRQAGVMTPPRTEGESVMSTPTKDTHKPIDQETIEELEPDEETEPVEAEAFRKKERVIVYVDDDTMTPLADFTEWYTDHGYKGTNNP